MIDEFYRTVGGRRFIEATMPKVADELARLNKNLEALVLAIRGSSSPQPPHGQQPRRP